MTSRTIFEQLLMQPTGNGSFQFLVDKIVIKPIKRDQVLLASCDSTLSNITLIRLANNLPCNSIKITIAKLEQWYATNPCWQRLEKEVMALLFYSKQRSYYLNTEGLFEMISS
ncbi:MAG: hypothetical protein K0S11_1067 [Gammaproteobacteria bacterium]|jgi:hypothetical protein|nr:hypothetical protein [Gammaproteobacteria bacterium]